MRPLIVALALASVGVWGLAAAGAVVVGVMYVRVKAKEREVAASVPTAIPPTPARTPVPVWTPPPVEPRPPIDPRPPVQFRPVPPVVRAVPPGPGELPINSNAVLKKLGGQATASTEWAGWPANKVIDGTLETSWFSSGPPPAGGGHWLKVVLPSDARVTRVTVIGNREPQWRRGYTVAACKIELLDAAGKVLASATPGPVGASSDFDFKPAAPVDGVRAVRFVATQDEFRQNGAGNVALGEVQVE